MTAFRHDEFDKVDQAASADPFIEFLARIEQVPDVVTRRQRSYELLEIVPGSVILDVGCGIGTVSADLAALGARPIGVDAAEAMIAAARHRLPDLEFRQASAEDLPFDDRSVAGYRAERVYQHIADPGPPLAEARRVLAPGGRIVLVDQDWDGYLIDSDDRPTTRAIVDAYADSFRNGWIGRQYRRLLLDAGFDDVRIEIQAIPLTDFAVLGPLLRDSATKAVDAGAVSPDAGNAWFADLERRAADDRFFVAMSHFVAAARVAR